MDRVRSWWDSYQVHGAPSFILANKLKLLKNDLKRWNVEVFGHVEVRIKKLVKDLSVLENMEESRGLSMEERVEMGRICEELEKATMLDEYVGGKNLEFSVLGKETGILNFFIV